MRKRSNDITDRLDVPEFRSAQEEAEWFDRNGAHLMELVARYGKVVPGRHVEPTQQLTLRIPVADIERARRIAADKGLPYQTVLKQAIRAGLAKAG